MHARCSEDIGCPVHLGYEITRECVVRILVEEHGIFAMLTCISEKSAIKLEL